MRDKSTIRESVWSAMVEAGAARGRNVRDRIPDFHGSQEAAGRMFNLPAWQNARVIKSNPDRPQRPIRQRALQEGKVCTWQCPG